MPFSGKEQKMISVIPVIFVERQEREWFTVINVGGRKVMLRYAICFIWFKEKN